MDYQKTHAYKQLTVLFPFLDVYYIFVCWEVHAVLLVFILYVIHNTTEAISYWYIKMVNYYSKTIYSIIVESKLYGDIYGHNDYVTFFKDLTFCLLCKAYKHNIIQLFQSSNKLFMSQFSLNLNSEMDMVLQRVNELNWPYSIFHEGRTEGLVYFQ